ncbi:MAG TPA: hypothetical protein VLT84_07565 [Acidobacteriota bacterium]|nr:hypothetical protein [Acidobacteriota bacterium]
MRTTRFAAGVLAALLAASLVAPRAVGSPEFTCDLRLAPRVLELDTRALWVTATIEPAGFLPQQIDLSSLRLQGAVTADNKGTGIGDDDGDGRMELHVRFPREALHRWLAPGENEITLDGTLHSGEEFRGTCMLRVIPPSPRGPFGVRVVSPPGTLPVRFVVDRADSRRYQARVFDARGRLVASWSALAGGGVAAAWNGRAGDGTKASPGVYFIRLENGGSAWNGRAVILE